MEDDRRGDDVAVNAGWERGRAGLRCDMVDVEEGRGGIESRAIDYWINLTFVYCV